MFIFWLVCEVILHEVFSFDELYSKPGSTLVFICPHRKLSSNNIVWGFTNRTGRFFSLTDGTYKSTQNPSHDRVSVVGDHTMGEFNLKLTNLQTMDEGQYSCSVNNGGTIQQKQYTFRLLVAPASVQIHNMSTMNKLTGSEGHDLTVSCSASGGVPPANVTLLIDDTSLATNIQTVKYVLGSISRDYDQQTITCESSNDANIDNPITTTALIYLILKPSMPVITPNLVETNETKPLVAMCSSNGSRPAATLFWFIGNINVTSSTTLQTVHVPSDDTYTATSTLTYNVDRNHNNKTIICTAVNAATTMGLSTSKQLDIKYAPSVNVKNATYYQNNTVRVVTCQPDGNPPQYVYHKWEHRSIHGQLIRELNASDHNILTLPLAPESKRYQDSGVYLCSVSNGIVGKDGKVHQMGSGFVTINAEPVLTRNNEGSVHYAEIGKDTAIHVNVYSVPKYNLPRWYRNNVAIISPPKYLTTDVQAIVTDNFHGTDVQLDGYRLSLTIKKLAESDVNVSYTLQLSNGIGRTREFVVFLQSASAPQTPLNVTILRSTDTSIMVKWISGYDGGMEQTLYLQYQRRDGTESWITIPIPEKHIQPDGFFSLYTLSGLQSKTVYLLRLYSENAYSRSLESVAVIAETTSKDNQSSAAVVGGVIGAASAIIIIIVFFIVVYFKRHSGYLCREKQKINKRENRNVSSSHRGVSYQNQVSLYDEVDDSSNKQINEGVTDTRHNLRFKEYETIGTLDKPNEYDELTHIENRKDATNNHTIAKEIKRRDSVDEQPHTYLELIELDEKEKSELADGDVQYESLGLRDKARVYEKLTSQSNKENKDNSKSGAQYELLGERDKPAVYEKLSLTMTKDQQERTEHYESLGKGNKPNVYDELNI